MLTSWLLACTSGTIPSDSTPADSDPVADDTQPVDTAPPVEAPKNLLILTIDTLRRNELGIYGGDADTPVLDGLLGSGRHYTDTRSCSNWTYPGMACGMLGVDIVEHDFLPGTSDPATTSLPGDITTIAEKLQGGGFRTALVSGNGIVGPSLGFAAGFDTVQIEDGGTGEQLVELALGVLDGWQAEDTEAPWALHLHLMDPHLPYDPPLEYMAGLEKLEQMPWDLTSRPGIQGLAEARALGTVDDETWELANALIRGGYQAELAYMDDALERFMAELETRDAVDDTLFVLWSDHGESFGENDIWLHHMSIYAAESMAIGAMVHPGSIPESEVDEPIAIQAFGPMALELLGVETYTAPEGPRFNDATMPDGFLTSVEQDGFRLIFESWTGGLELYELAADPAESENLYAPGDARVASMWELLGPRAATILEIAPESLYVDPVLD